MIYTLAKLPQGLLPGKLQFSQEKIETYSPGSKRK
jgi:hypothetical protein